MTTQVGDNITATVEGDELVLRIKTDTTLGRSKSGNSTLIATTRGSKPCPGIPGAHIGVNIYK